MLSALQINAVYTEHTYAGSKALLKYAGLLRRSGCRNDDDPCKGSSLKVIYM